jgi:DsbC/DsbD-like thiol-disulfide interchange protein
MKKLLSIAILSLGLLFLAGSSVNAQTVGGSVGAVTRGGSTKGTVVLRIPGGLHTNSNRPSKEYLKATVVRVSAAGAKTSAVSYPRGRNRKFQFSDELLNVYEGTVSFSFNLTVPASFKGNVVRVRASVAYQACNDEVCFQPTTKEVTLTAKVK